MIDVANIASCKPLQNCGGFFIVVAQFIGL
jgi:hypothetical protein